MLCIKKVNVKKVVFIRKKDNRSWILLKGVGAEEILRNLVYRAADILTGAA
jgi:hypothetical protein